MSDFKTLAELVEENRELRKDKERLDWIDYHTDKETRHLKWGGWLINGVFYGADRLRDAIDAARGNSTQVANSGDIIQPLAESGEKQQLK